MKLVLVEWEDSHGTAAGWAPLADSKPELLVVRSVGWLLHDTAECKVIVPHVVEPGENSRIETQGRGEMTIPTSCIVKITDLNDPEQAVSGQPHFGGTLSEADVVHLCKGCFRPMQRHLYGEWYCYTPGCAYAYWAPGVIQEMMP